MLHVLSMLAVLAAPQGPAPAPVVINEFSYDDSGTDDLEYVELYNNTSNPIDISSWTIHDEDSLGISHVYTINAGTTIAANGFFVWGSSLVPNVTQAVVGGTNLLENSDEGIVLTDNNGRVIDRVDYETLNLISWQVGMEGDGLSGGYVAVAAIETSLQRIRDGVDTNVNGADFRLMPWTPGVTNNVVDNLPYVDIFDGKAVGTILPAFAPSFVEAKVVDPTSIGNPLNPNPNVIPASPQGGEAATFWDPTGGGDANVVITEPAQNVVFECYAYVESTLPPDVSVNTFGNGDSWSLGVRGSVDSFGHHPEITGLFMTSSGGTWQSGCTGIAWVYQRLSPDSANAFAGYTTLWLVDFGDGGADFKVLHTEQIQLGVNDGWQRLRLMVAGDRVHANFGGTFGQDDGVVIDAKTATTQEGGIYVGFREHFSNNALCRPPTVDQLVIRRTSMNSEHVGTAFANTAGTPQLDADNVPYLGNTGFAVRGSSLIPSQAGVLLIGVQQHPAPGISLGLIGGPPQSFVQVNSFLSLTVMANGSGESVTGFPVPTTGALSGARLLLQLFGVDPGLPFAIKLANTDVLRLTLGT